MNDRHPRRGFHDGPSTSTAHLKAEYTTATVPLPDDQTSAAANLLDGGVHTRIVRPQHATGMSGPQDLCLEWRRSKANRARGTGTIRARTCRSRTLLKRGASDGPLGLAEAWTTGQELNRAVANQPKFEIASGAANAKIEVGPHSFAFQRPNAGIKPCREAASA